MNEQAFLKIVAEALEIEDLTKISLKTTADDLEEWDSLGHLSILSALDDATNGKISSIDGLSDMYSLAKLYEVVLSLRQ